MADKIAQVLVFSDARRSEELGPILWAAFKEVERFWSEAGTGVTFERRYIAESVPSAVARDLGANTILGRFGWLFGQTLWSSSLSTDASDQILQKSRGTVTRSYDFRRIADGVRERVGMDASRYLIVVDETLTPPPEWRYIISDGDERDGVVSILPVDPTYWRSTDPHRLATIKHRVRTACLGIVGEFLGLKPCDNPTCVMCGDVDSVVRLDGMVSLCERHNLPSLTGRGFSVLAANLDQPQPLTGNPTPGEEAPLYV